MEPKGETGFPWTFVGDFLDAFAGAEVEKMD